MIMSDVWRAFSFVHGQPFFWTSMMYSTLMAMFFGATIYDGELPHAKRGVASVIAYAFMAVLVTINYAWHRYPNLKPDVAFQVFIYPVQLFYLSIFWVFGFILAICMYRWLHKKMRRK